MVATSITGRQSNDQSYDFTQTLSTSGSDEIIFEGVGARGLYRLHKKSPQYYFSSDQFRLSDRTIATYKNVEIASLNTGYGDSELVVADTADNTILNLLVGDGHGWGTGAITIETTGNNSLTNLLGGQNRGNTITVKNTGDGSALLVETGKSPDQITIEGRGTGSAIQVKPTPQTLDVQSQGRDQFTIGIDQDRPEPPLTGQQSMIVVSGAFKEDLFVVNEVFPETVIDLDGAGGNDMFQINVSGANANGDFLRLNNHSSAHTGSPNNQASRQLLLSGGPNRQSNSHSFAKTTRKFVEGVRVSRSLSRIDASEDDPEDRATTANEFFETVGIENVRIVSGQGSDVLTVSSHEIALGISSTGQMIGFDGQGSEDRLEIIGTDFILRAVGTIGDRRIASDCLQISVPIPLAEKQNQQAFIFHYSLF